MGSCNTSTNCNPCGPEFNAINQLATRAGAYARQANTYAVDAENSWLEFNALYLGAFASAPSVDNEGNPLQVGALYWNSVSNNVWAWSGTAWVAFDDFNETTLFLANGTTEPRNLVTRTADFVNVKDYGAKGDYTTDDTAAIQAAINSLAANGGTVFFPNGRYRTTATLTIDNRNIELKGNGCGRFTNTLFVETLNNVASCAPSGATQIIGDFTSGPVVRIKQRGCSVINLTIDSTSSASGGNTPISTGSQGRKGSTDANAHGIWVESDDIAGVSTLRTLISNVAVYNQPKDGILFVNNIVSSRIDFTEVTCCNRHAISIQSGRYSGRVNRERAGQVQISNAATSRCGGHGLVVGGAYEINIEDAPYRIEINNFESYYNLIVPAEAIIPSIPANCFLSGENHVMIDSAFDGRTRFGLVNNDPYIPIYIQGRNIEIFNFRAISGTPYAAYVGLSPSIGTWGVNFQSFYQGNEVTPSFSYNPAIFIANSNCRGVRATADLSMGQVVALTNKVANSNYEESYTGTTTTDIKYTFRDDVRIEDDIFADAYRSTITPVEINIANDEAFYIEFNNITRGLACISGNAIGRKAGIFHFRCGDGTSLAEAIAASSTNVAVTTGPLTGTTGSAGDLTFSVDTSLNRIYLENRTLFSGAFNFTFLGLNAGAKINSYAII
jgi:hypothetical protein